jgi:predicted esterase
VGRSSGAGRVYRGFDAALAIIEAIFEREAGSAIGILGFSQGSIFGSALAALSAQGKLPPIRFAVLVAGRIPRADDLLPCFEHPIAIPSLHVWGERDALCIPSAEELSCRFDPSSREVCVWPGPHVLPGRGLGADAIVRFVERFV